MLTRRETDDILSMSLCKNKEYMESIYKHFDELCNMMDKFHIETLNSIELLIIKALISAQVEWCDIFDCYDDWVKQEMEKEGLSNDN